MVRLKALALGATAFVVSHLVESAAWRSTFASADGVRPWFLNSGRAVAFTAACLLIATSIAFAWTSRSTHPSRRSIVDCALTVAAGAWVAMAVVLAIAGPGTIFPVALAFGALVAVLACSAGALIGAML